MSNPAEQSKLAEQLKMLNRSRGNCKSRITKLQNFLKEKAPSADLYQMQSKLEVVSEISAQVRELKISYYELLDDAQLADTERIFEEIEDDLEEVKVSLKKLLFELNNNLLPNSVELNAVKLPYVSLPEFYGDIDSWNNFKSQFDSLITNNGSLNDIQKLYYLRSALKGNVKNIETPEDTFRSLMNVLIEQFENRRLMANTHIMNILNIEKINIESAKSLRNLVDVINKNLRGLNLMNLETNELTQQILINIILQKLDKDSRKQYEMTLTSTELPNWETFIEFLKKRSQVLENVQSVQLPLQKPKLNQNRTKSFMINRNSDSCVLCGSSHAIYRCSLFLKLTPIERFNVAKKHKLCLSCLATDSHQLISCKSKYACKLCKSQSHNYLLCRLKPSDPIIEETLPKRDISSNVQQSSTLSSTVPMTSTNTKVTNNAVEPQVLRTFSSINKMPSKVVLLSTALVNVWSPVLNHCVRGRALLDSASQSNFMTSQFAHQLGLTKKKINVPVSGLNGHAMNIKWKVNNTFIRNNDSSFTLLVDFLIVPKITDFVPSSLPNAEIKFVDEATRSKLADPTFDKPGRIDLILGAESFYQIIKDGRQSLDSLVLINSVFGFVVSGSIESNQFEQHCYFISCSENIDDNLKKFWELEEVSSARPLSPEEEICEHHFEKTHKRDMTGRFVVQMPVKEEELHTLGDSRILAEKRLQQTIRRLNKNADMKKLYFEFLEDYESQGHMEKVIEEVLAPVIYYLPHHGVFKADKSTTKLRVVFNGSALTTSGRSLNDILFAGKVQEDVFDIMLRFRKHKIVVTADIKQMFRQILIDPTQLDLLRILWKTKEYENPIEYKLKTVTYGTKCAPFLATRVIKQLASDESLRFPLAAEIAYSDIYMDDIVTGCQNIETSRILKKQLIEMFKTCGMTLHKWNSNCNELLEIGKSDFEQHLFCPLEESSPKTLGMVWKSKEDKFVFKVENRQHSFTKREVLSTIAKLYDPFGLLGPVICKAKIFLQKLWLEKINWDDKLPKNLETEWHRFVHNLKEIETISIDRYFLHPDARLIVLLGFCDASISAYGAVVYLRWYNENFSSTSNLIASKSRVSPLKTVSIPRLELCSCLLLSQLVDKIIVSLKLHIDKILLFSDSTIALCWINSSPHLLKTFVGNRVSKIQSFSSNYQWKHIASSENPADLISRGVDPSDLKNLDLWWYGPQMTLEDIMNSSIKTKISSTEEDLLSNEFKKVELCAVVQKTETLDIINNCSSFLKLQRVVAWCFRFIANCKNRIRGEVPVIGCLSTCELSRALQCIVQVVQLTSFPEEIHCLKSGKPLPRTSNLLNLCPFLDSNGILRVGGRLKNSMLGLHQKHPILIPNNHNVTYLIINHYHVSYFHIGAEGTLSFIRGKFWIVRGRNIVRKLLNGCITCKKVSSKGSQQVMADLPSERITPSRVFNKIGVDFAGPFTIKTFAGRTKNFYKCFVCIFICFAVRAVHFEIVNGLTTEAFLASLKRFVARRGKPSEIFSDNGTNFVGANNELRKIVKALFKNHNEKIEDYVSKEGIKWNFNPPAAPHFGGLWEAGIKSLKYHLKRVIGNSILSYEEFLTLVTQVEAVLNSRPLCALSNDPNDISVLTPAHFLIGSSLVDVPDFDYIEIPMNRLNRWQLVQKFTQVIWKKWSNEYLNRLQQRPKWSTGLVKFKEGEVVLVKNSDQSKYLKWHLAKIVKIHPGKDNVTRVVTIKDKTGVYQRPVTKIVALPYVN